MNSKEIIEKLKVFVSDSNYDPEQLANGDMMQEDWDDYQSQFGEVQQADLHRSNSEYICVLYFKQHNVYIQWVGDYNSWSGTEWSGAEPFEVKPVSKTITVWEEVK